jgi:integrase
MATIRKRTNRKGTVWQIDYYDPQGKRVMKCFPLKKDAEAYLGKVQAAKREGRYHDVFDVKKESQVSFDDLADRYIENFQSQKCFSRLKYYLVDEYRAVFGGRRLSEIGYLDLETYRNRRKATLTRTGKPRTDATVNRELSTLRHMLNKAVEACSPHLKPIVETALLTGMRREELLSLKWEQIRNGFIYLTETKSGKARQIPINDRLAEVFKEVRRGNQLKSPHIFCDAQGRRFYQVRRSFVSACRRAGIEAFRFHDLRHTFASQLVMKGASLKAVQELLGHTDLKMTMRYAHLSQEHLKDSVNLLNDMPSGKEMVNITPKANGAKNLPSANIL